MLHTGHDNLSLFKIHDFRLSSRQADNQLAGKSLLHMQTLGYQGKMCLKYMVMSVQVGTLDLMVIWLTYITPLIKICLFQLIIKVGSC